MSNRLRELREDVDLSQTKLAAMLGMSQTGYSKYETEENDIPTQILIKLSKLYNTSIDYLLCQTSVKNLTGSYSKLILQTTTINRIKERINCPYPLFY